MEVQWAWGQRAKRCGVGTLQGTAGVGCVNGELLTRLKRAGQARAARQPAVVLDRQWCQPRTTLRPLVEIEAASEPFQPGFGWDWPWRGKPPKRERKEGDLSLWKQLACAGKVCLLCGGVTVLPNDLESNRIWQCLWAVGCLRLQR